MPKHRIDQIDRKILTRLQKDGRIANNDLAPDVALKQVRYETALPLHHLKV
jgi:DNA-binding Lrp family transcriptional regulator